MIRRVGLWIAGIDGCCESDLEIPPSVRREPRPGLLAGIANPLRTDDAQQCDGKNAGCHEHPDRGGKRYRPCSRAREPSGSPSGSTSSLWKDRRPPTLARTSWTGKSASGWRQVTKIEERPRKKLAFPWKNQNPGHDVQRLPKSFDHRHYRAARARMS